MRLQAIQKDYERKNLKIGKLYYSPSVLLVDSNFIAPTGLQMT